MAAAFGRIYREGLAFLLNSAIAVDDALELPYIYDVMAAISRMSPLAYRTPAK